MRLARGDRCTSLRRGRARPWPSGLLKVIRWSLTSNPDTRECGLGEKRSSNLAEVKDEVDRITANYFSNIFL